MLQQVDSNRMPRHTSFLSRLAANTYRYAELSLPLIVFGMLRVANLSLQSIYRFSEVRYALLHPAGKALVIISTALCFYYSLSNTLYYPYRVSMNNKVLFFSAISFAGVMTYWLW